MLLFCCFSLADMLQFSGIGGDIMDYRKMYYILCRAISESLDLLPETVDNACGRALLQKALLEAEEVYLSDGGDRERAAEESAVSH